MSLTPDIELIRQVFDYNPVTGDIRYKVSRGRMQIGALAGFRMKDGRVNIRLNGRPLKAHRLAWALHYGKWPETFIDHANGDPGDNRIVNLREATPSQNNQNRKLSKKSRFGLKGVCTDKRRPGLFEARICAERGRQVSLGFFRSPEQAHKAYCTAAQEIYGEFANPG